MKKFRRPDPTAERLQQLGLDRRAADRLSRHGTVLNIDPGTVLCRTGERGTQAFLLLDGEVEVVTAADTITVGSGAVVGELATLDPHRTRNATVTVTGRVRILVFDVATYRFLAQQAELASHLAPERVAA